MSNMNDDSSMKDNIVKLHVSGATRVVNTIKDQKTASGLSLVCPFPSLEVDIPIRFTNASGDECEGSIHRIGVEDDPVTGLPKLRLSVRNEKNEEIPDWMTPSEDLFAEPDAMEKAVDEILSNAMIKEASVDADDEEEEGFDVVVPANTAEFAAERANDNTAGIEPSAGQTIDGYFPGVQESVHPEDEKVTARAISTSDDAILTVPETGENTLLESLFDQLPDTNTAELLSLDELDTENPGIHSRDPEWVSYTDMPALGAFQERAQTRRRRRAIAVAAWMMVLGIAAGGLYVLGKAGVVDVGNARRLISASDDAKLNEASNDALDQLATQSNSEPADMNKVAPAVTEKPTLMPASAATVPNGQDIHATVGNNTLAEADAADQDMVEEDAVEDGVNQALVAVDDAETQDDAALGADDSPNAASDLSNTEVILPTRWPAEFATAYRLQNPNGVVVDVPGGLVKREGWLNMKDDDKIIRSIKAVQRENGARFIVYVKGNLPNFKTTPRSGGVRLSLYYDSEERTSEETQQVAMLDAK